MNKLPLLAVALALVFTHVVSSEAQVSVSFADGKLTIQCSNASLSDVFAQIETQSGVELTIEDSVKSKRVTADLVDEPLQRAIQRLLDGVGVNYIVLMDPSNWERVNKIFVGAGGGGTSSPGPARSAPPPAPVADDGYGDDEMDNFDEMDDMDDFNEDGFAEEEAMEGLEPPMDAFPQDPQNGNPGGPGFNYFPQNDFQRSNVTPGAPSTPPFSAPVTPTNPAQPQPGQFGNQGGGAPPPATFPFTDPYGRPVPVPPGMQQNQQQNRNNPPQ